jgi:ABC-type transporter Mla subunit MlaD
MTEEQLALLVQTLAELAVQLAHTTDTALTQNLTLIQQNGAILMALSDDVAVLLQAIADERGELQARFDELKAQIAAGADAQAQIDALQAQLDAGDAAVVDATAAVQALSDTGNDPVPPPVP